MGHPKQDGTFVETLASVVASKLFHFFPKTRLSAGGDGRLLRLLRSSLLLSLHFLLSLFSLLFSRLPSPPRRPSPRSSAPVPPCLADSTSSGRALSRVLSSIARVPVASRKYNLLCSLAERLLHDNLRPGCSGGGAEGAELRAVNCAALSAAFARTLRHLEAAVAAEVAPAAGDGDGSGGRIMGAVKSRVRRWAEGGAAAGEGGAGWSAEKLAAEAMWLGQKMAESGAAEDAVAMWAAAAGLARLAVSAEPRLQVSFVRLCAFLFKYANSRQLEEGMGGKEEGINPASSQMALLKSWLPLLCGASNGVDTPTLSRRERAEMESLLGEMIEKLSWDQQEEVLSLWLHHFTIFPDSDWPNLEFCYMRWYSESRELL